MRACGVRASRWGEGVGGGCVGTAGGARVVGGGKQAPASPPAWLAARRGCPATRYRLATRGGAWHAHLPPHPSPRLPTTHTHTHTHTHSVPPHLACRSGAQSGGPGWAARRRCRPAARGGSPPAARPAQSPAQWRQSTACGGRGQGGAGRAGRKGIEKWGRQGGVNQAWGRHAARPGVERAGAPARLPSPPHPPPTPPPQPRPTPLGPPPTAHAQSEHTEHKHAAPHLLPMKEGSLSPICTSAACTSRWLGGGRAA